MFNIEELYEEIKDQELGIIKKEFQEAVMTAAVLRKVAEVRNLLNEQDYLDFEDSLNVLSVMSPEEKIDLESWKF
jgi:hypothetical protein